MTALKDLVEVKNGATVYDAIRDFHKIKNKEHPGGDWGFNWPDIEQLENPWVATITHGSDNPFLNTAEIRYWDCVPGRESQTSLDPKNSTIPWYRGTRATASGAEFIHGMVRQNMIEATIDILFDGLYRADVDEGLIVVSPYDVGPIVEEMDRRINLTIDKVNRQRKLQIKHYGK